MRDAGRADVALWEGGDGGAGIGGRGRGGVVSDASILMMLSRLRTFGGAVDRSACLPTRHRRLTCGGDLTVWCQAPVTPRRFGRFPSVCVTRQ